MPQQKTEYWLSGPVEGIAPLLQPVAHAILQSQREVQDVLQDFPAALLWQRPGAVAPVAFHVQHIAGVIDRLFTYAREEELSTVQWEALQQEGMENSSLTSGLLLQSLHEQVEKALEQLRMTKEESLLHKRYVGRKRIPSNVLGLLFHAAEHVQRHTGQLLVTTRVVLAADAP